MHIAKGFPKWQDFSAVTIENSLLSGKINREVPVCLQRCEETGRIENIRRAAQDLGKGYCGRFFNDSDLYKVFLYKVLKGAALSLHPDEELERPVMKLSNISPSSRMGTLPPNTRLQHTDEKLPSTQSSIALRGTITPRRGISAEKFSGCTLKPLESIQNARAIVFSTDGQPVTAIPYFAWDNRSEEPMMVSGSSLGSADNAITAESELYTYTDWYPQANTME